MIRWLQTSLFGRVLEMPAEKPPVKSSKSKSRKPAAVPPSEFLSEPDPDLAARWNAVRADLPVRLVLVPRLRQGWRMEWRRGMGSDALLRVPKIFAEAPEDLLLSLAAWARLAMQRTTRRTAPARRLERQTLEKALHVWIAARHEGDGHTQKLVRGRAARRLERLETRGAHHDLEAILASINAGYFEGKLEAKITWSSRWGGLSTQTTAKDEAGKPYALLTISRGYDHPSASAEIVGGVVYHECLHIAVPPESRGGRRIVHGREFRRREKEYRFYEAWRKWHAEKLPGIIRRGP